MSLHLVQILPNHAALAKLAHGAGLPDDDPGYLWHFALRKAFGTLAPQPFRSLERSRPAAPGHVQLLGYSPADQGELCDALALAAPDLERVFPPDQVRSKALLPFAAGRRLAFETRICPIVRCKSCDGSHQRELDVFVHHASKTPDQPIDRATVYRDWLGTRLAAGGAHMIDARMTSFRLPPLVRRRHASPGGRTATREAPARRLRAKDGRKSARRPDVVLEGILEVREPEIFAQSLAAGIGRHRAFGFGMLLLRPA